MSRRSSLSLPSGIQDREDRMLAYYINLIKQQEEEANRQRSDSMLSVDDREVGEVKKKDQEVKPVSEKPSPSEDGDIGQSGEAPVKRPVGRPRKHPLPPQDTAEVSQTKVTPKKSTKQLELDEAERIISTIMERRPGRAEFKVPTVVDKESEKPAPTESTTPKKSAKTLALEEAERIIATIERRPTATSAKALEEIAKDKGEKGQGDEMGENEKGIGRAEKEKGNEKTRKEKVDEETGKEAERTNVDAVSHKIKDKDSERRKPKEIEEVKKLVTEPQMEPEDQPLVKKRGPGRPPKRPPSAVTEKVVPVVEPPNPSVAEPKTVPTPKKKLPSPAKPPVVEKPKQEVKTELPTQDSNGGFSFPFHHPVDRGMKWWQKPVGLRIFRIEDDLDNVLGQVVKKARETRDDVLRHAMEQSEPFLGRMVLSLE